MIRDNARILWRAAALAVADSRAIHTWKTWTFAWLSRLFAQVAFFALIGRLLNSRQATQYLFVGNSVYIVTMLSMFACVSAAWERYAGTLPLLISAPASPLVVFAGRGLNWLADGTVCASIALFALGPLFDVPMPWPQALFVVPLVMVTGASSYCLALAAAGLVLRNVELRNLVTNLVYFGLMLLCGVQVPTSFLPFGLRILSTVLPLTHGLAAIRALLARDDTSTVLAQAGLEVVVGIAWLAVAAVAMRHFVRASRRNGSVEFG